MGAELRKGLGNFGGRKYIWLEEQLKIDYFLFYLKKRKKKRNSLQYFFFVREHFMENIYCFSQNKDISDVEH